MQESLIKADPVYAQEDKMAVHVPSKDRATLRPTSVRRGEQHMIYSRSSSMFFVAIHDHAMFRVPSSREKRVYEDH